MDPNLTKVTEIFLVPSSFLVAALGTADTNIHRASVSLVGLIISVLWLISAREACPKSDESVPGQFIPIRVRILAWLPLIFIVGWFISTVGHTYLWNQPLGA